MKPATLQSLRQAAGAKPLTALPQSAPPIRAISTNSRLIEPQSLFVALRGERHDGHDYLQNAADAGAIAALVEHVPPVIPQGLHLLQASNTYAALGRLARFVRQQMRCKVIAVAGSNGKTGTKLLIDAALRGRLRGTISPRSFNNNVGVPLTLFPADPMQDYVVLEMGTNHHGEIKPLTEMALPDIAVITNAGAEHLEGLDDLMGVRRENASIIEGLSPKGLLVVNGDDADLLSAVAGYTGQRLTFGFNKSNDLFAADVRSNETGVRFRLNGRRDVFIPLLGAHTACNALAAIAVGRKLMLSEDVIIEGLAHADGPEMRLQFQRHDDVTILNDAYNANPSSMRAALQSLGDLTIGQRRIAVLGDMLELGRASERYHREIGKFAAETARMNLLVCVGDRARAYAEAATEAGFDADAIQQFHDAPTAAEALVGLLQTGDLVLLKASRGIRLETIAAAISARSVSKSIQKAAS